MTNSTDLIQKAYLGKRVHDLLVTLTNQLTEVYQARGITVPVIASSTLDYLHRIEGASVADIARALDITHQLATQRIEKLWKRGLVTKRHDPDDARRVIWLLSSEGNVQAERLAACMRDAIQVHEKLFSDIGVNLISTLDTTLAALTQSSLFERFEAITDIDAV